MLLIIFYFLAGVHLLQLILLFGPLIRYRKTANLQRPAFSIIVAARNEYQNLKELIPLLIKQQYPDFEIIIALDRCEDESENYLAGIASKDHKVQFITIDELPANYSGKKYALTRAIELARNEWLLFTDADCRPSSHHWIQSFAESIQPVTEILLGVSPYINRYSILNQFIQYETITTALKYISAALRHKPYMGVGRNMAYKKELFKTNKGFHPYEAIIGGDDDLFVQKTANKMNTQVVLGVDSLTYTSAKNDLKAYLHQKTRHLNIGKSYKKKLTHVDSAILHAMLWLSFLYLALIQPENPGVISTFILLIIIKGLIFNLASGKMGFNYNPIFLPISDLIYGILYPFIGFRALLFRKVKWK